MPNTGEQAYAYAKACGIIGKSFIGQRVSRLIEVNRLSELDRLVFPQENKDLPEQALLVDLEDRIIQRGVDQIMTIINSFQKPPELFLRLIRSYEYEDLKAALGGMAHKETKNPGFTDIGRFRTVAFEAYPNLDLMLRGTEFTFLLAEDLRPDTSGEPPESHVSETELQIKLDQHYYTALWNALMVLPKKDSGDIQKILSEEIALRNAVLALRMRRYYSMPPKEIREKFITIKEHDKAHRFTGPAEASLALPLDQRADWTHWKWYRFLNPENPQEPWRADPRYFQNAAAEYLYRLARYSFRRSAFSLDSIFCFIKLKLFEEDLLTSVAEGLGLGISSRDVFSLLEVES